MNKPKDQGNVFYLIEGGKAAVKTKSNKKLNFGQTVLIKKISGSTITVTPDNTEVPDAWAIIDAKWLHTNDMPY